MNIITSKYREKYGSIEPYIVMKLEISILLALTITVFSLFLQPWVMALNIFTAFIAIHSLYQIREKHPNKLKIYVATFGTLYATAVILPKIITDYAVPLSISTAYTLLTAMIIVLFIMIGIRLFMSKRGIKAEVKLADKEHAIVKPEYDFLAGIKPKEYAIKNTLRAKKGDKVTIEISRTPLSPPKPRRMKKIIERGERK